MSTRGTALWSDEPGWLPDADRPYGLYGNAFARAPVAAVLRATRHIDPPTASDILAVEAPPDGAGRYTLAQLFDVVTIDAMAAPAGRLAAPRRQSEWNRELNLGCDDTPLRARVFS